MARNEDGEDGPERTCIASRRTGSPDEMIRFVLGPEGQVVPDLRRKLPGRGAWVSATRAMVDDAVRKKAFSRAFKTQAAVSPSLAEEVEGLLVRAAREALSLANKAGLVVSGFSKVEAAIAGKPLAGVIHARDAAADGVRKIGQALRRRLGDAYDGIEVSRALDSPELDLALGRAHVIHAALLDGPASRACMARFRALEHYRTGGAPGSVALPEPIEETTGGSAGRDTNE